MSGIFYQPQADIRKLMTLYEQELPALPTVASAEIRLLRCRLNFEETLEFITASGCEVVARVNEDGQTSFEVQSVPGARADIVGIADGLGDSLVVTYGALNAFGILAKPVWDEIQRSNLSKVWPDGTIHKRADGKVLKPDTYSPADLKTVLRNQIAQKLVQMDQASSTDQVVAEVLG